jgi:hypothetical protein
MSESKHDDPSRHQSRATIWAALIGSLGVIIAAWIGVSVGQGRGEEQVESLRKELVQRDAVIAELRQEVASIQDGRKKPSDPSETRIAGPSGQQGSSFTPSAAQPSTEPVQTSTQPPPTQQGPIREVTTQEFKFKFDGCTRSSSNVRCELLVEDLVGDRDFKIDSGEIRDNNGHAYQAKRFYLGAESGPFHVHSTLPPGIATRAALEFESVRAGTSVLELLELKGHTLDKAQSRVVVRFPKIPL